MRGKFKNAGTHIILIIASFISVFPLYWMIAAATNNSTDVLGGKLSLGMNFMQNLTKLTEMQNVSRAFFNSLFYSTILSVLSLFICSIAGYGFEIYHDKVKDRLMNILLLAMMVPFAATLIPLFKLFSGMGLSSTWIAYVLPMISTPFLIMLFRQSARSFPMEIIEAARIDGLSEFKIFFTIFMPTMKSTYAAALTVTFMNAWNNYLWPKVIMMSDTSQTMPMLVANQYCNPQKDLQLTSASSDTSQTMPMLVANLSVGYSIDYGVLMLGVLICSLPTGILFLVLQKNFANGIVGAVKG